MLTEHPALLTIFEDLRTYLMKLLANRKEGHSNVEVTTAEHRAHAIFLRVVEIDNCLRSLRLAIVGLQAEAKSSAPNVEQYRYHVENYLFRLIGIYDRACRFSGTVIGMTALQVDKQSGNSQVTTNLKHLGLSGANDSLAKLKALLKPYSDNRNIVAHAGEYTSRQIALFSAVADIKLESIDPDELLLLMNEHFQDEAIDFGLLTLQIESLLHQLIETLALEI